MTQSKKPEALWITWEDHRRSRELSDAFEAEYCPVLIHGHRWYRYPLQIVKTLRLLASRRPGRVFCQNPSLILTTLLCSLKSSLGYRLIVDRHSNFKLDTYMSYNPKWRLFHLLSRWTTRKADLTIVTNPRLAELVAQWKGQPQVLQDPLPPLESSGETPDMMADKPRPWILCVTSYGDDEPIEALLESLANLGGGHSFLTGKYEKSRWARQRESLAHQGITLTGFVTDSEYVDLMASCDVVVVLTLYDDLLTCGAYEAISLGKPLVLSDTQALRNYFRDAPHYVLPDARSVNQGIRKALDTHSESKARVDELRQFLAKEWAERFNLCRDRIEARNN